MNPELKRAIIDAYNNHRIDHAQYPGTLSEKFTVCNQNFKITFEVSLSPYKIITPDYYKTLTLYVNQDKRRLFTSRETISPYPLNENGEDMLDIYKFIKEKYNKQQDVPVSDNKPLDEATMAKIIRKTFGTQNQNTGR